MAAQGTDLLKGQRGTVEGKMTLAELAEFVNNSGGEAGLADTMALAAYDGANTQVLVAGDAFTTDGTTGHLASEADAGVNVVDTSGRLWTRRISSPKRPEWFMPRGVTSGVTPTTMYMQAALDCARDEGDTIELSAVTYSVTGLTLNYASRTLSQISDRNVVGIQGQGAANTVIEAHGTGATQYALSITGGVGSGRARPVTHEGFSIVGTAANVAGSRTGLGLFLENGQQTTVENVELRNLLRAGTLNDVGLLTFRNLTVSECDAGLTYRSDALASVVDIALDRPRLITIAGWALAPFGSDDIWRGGALNEAVCNGVGSATTGGVWLKFSGETSRQGLTVNGGSFANNVGVADIYLETVGTDTVVHNFFGTSFRRQSAAAHTQSNIKIKGPATVNLYGCIFDEAGDYVVSASEPYIAKDETQGPVVVNCYGCTLTASEAAGSETNTPPPPAPTGNNLTFVGTIGSNGTPGTPIPTGWTSTQQLHATTSAATPGYLVTFPIHASNTDLNAYMAAISPFNAGATVTFTSIYESAPGVATLQVILSEITAFTVTLTIPVTS